MRYLILLGAVCASLSWRADSLRAADGCDQPGSAPVLVRCLLKRSPELLLQRSLAQRDEARELAADQIVNPELSGRALGGAGSSSGELTLEQTIQLGGKRSARRDTARTRAKLTRERLTLAREEAVLEATLLLHRLRHLKSRQHLLEETGALYARILRRMRGYPFLNSEQRVSLAVYRTALRDSGHKRIAIERESEETRARLRFLLNLPPEFTAFPLPTARRKWPALPATAANLVEQSASGRIVQLRREVARSRLALAKARAWPDMKIGPTIEARNSPTTSSFFGAGGGGSETEAGLSFAITLPLFHRNTGEREFARRELERAKLSTDLVRKQLIARRGVLVRAYQAALKKLKGSRSPAREGGEHARMRSLFLRGLVSPALVIEFHRELLEYLAAYQATEAAAVRSLAEIYLLDGRLLKEEFYEKLL